MEEDAEFVYLALERCRQSLHDLMAAPAAERQFTDEHRRPTPFCMQARSTFCVRETVVLNFEVSESLWSWRWSAAGRACTASYGRAGR